MVSVPAHSLCSYCTEGHCCVQLTRAYTKKKAEKLGRYPKLRHLGQIKFSEITVFCYTNKHFTLVEISKTMATVV